MIDLGISRSRINRLALCAGILGCTFLVPAIATTQEFDEAELQRMVGEKDYPPLTDSPKDRRLAEELLALLGGHLDRIGNIYLSKRMTDDDMSILTAFQDARGIVWGDSQIGDRGIEVLRKMKGLEYIGVLPPRVTDVGIKHLEGLPLKGVALPPLATNRSLQSLATLHQLNGVALSKNITDEGFQCVAGMPQIIGVYLNDSQVTDLAFANIGQNSKLCTIDFGTAPNITPEVVRHLRQLTQLHRIVGPHGTNDRTLELLADLGTLTFLDLSSYEGVTDEGMKYLPAHEWMNGLVLGPKITDAGMEPIGKLRYLGNLDLTKTQVTGEGLAYLGPYGPSKLEISDSVSDEGLASISKFTRLEFLILNGNFTDACLAHLPKRLHQVLFRHTKVTDQGLNRLRRERPGLIIDVQRKDESSQAFDQRSIDLARQPR